jgi:hypothetical protein
MIPAVVHEISGFCDAANCKSFEVQVFSAKLVALQILLAAATQYQTSTVSDQRSKRQTIQVC